MNSMALCLGTPVSHNCLPLYNFGLNLLKRILLLMYFTWILVKCLTLSPMNGYLWNLKCTLYRAKFCSGSWEEQAVVINGIKSSDLSGVPQGSAIDPLLRVFDDLPSKVSSQSDAVCWWCQAVLPISELLFIGTRHFITKRVHSHWSGYLISMLLSCLLCIWVALQPTSHVLYGWSPSSSSSIWAYRLGNNNRFYFKIPQPFNLCY